ncbi:MAG: ABC-2 family transporter protein [Patescibacteria group bacterium]|nr:ABC-2 family transporter protein [Patescibacteria group bacterium]
MLLAKYFIAFKNVLQSEIEFRANTLIRFFISLITLVSIFYLWNDVFSARAEIAGYTKEQIITYYILITFILASVITFSPVADNIRNGELSMYITRPISYIWYQYWLALAQRFMRVLIGLPILIIIFIIFREHVYIVTNPLSYLILLVTVFSAMNLLFFIDILINFLEFWFTNSWGMNMVFDYISSIFSGALIPLAFLPSWLITIGNFLPYQYTGAFLIDAFIGRISFDQTLLGILIQFVWMIILYIMSRIVWHLGLKRYEAYGS